MLTANGEIKVTDFGLASIGGEHDKALTRAGITVGTPLYMSPEQIEGVDVDIRSDIYSLGITVYHMLAGEPPFDGDSPLSIAVMHASKKAPSLAEHRTDLPEELVDIVSTMLLKDRAHRPQEPVELLKRLQPINVAGSKNFDWSLFEPLPGEHDGGKNMPATEQLASVRASSPKNRRWLGWTLSAIATGLLCFLGWWGGNRIASQYSGLQDQTTDSTDPGFQPIKVQKFKNVEEQYLSALWNSRNAKDSFEERERLWLAVLKYFPTESAKDKVRTKTQYYNLLTLSRLGELYLEAKELNKADEVYDQLAKQEELLLRFRTTGLAGKAIALAMRLPDHFEGDAWEQESEIRLCLNAEMGGVRENVDLLNQYLREKIETLLIRYPNYGKHSPGYKETFTGRAADSVEL